MGPLSGRRDKMPGVCCGQLCGGGGLDSCVPVRVKIRLWAFLLWLGFTLPNVIVTLTLYFTAGGVPADQGEGGGDTVGATQQLEESPTTPAAPSDYQDTFADDEDGEAIADADYNGTFAFSTFLGNGNGTSSSSPPPIQLTPEELEEFQCYDNITVYLPIYESARFWLEGVGLAIVGLLGLCGNGLTLAVLARSRGTKFNRLLVYLSVTDCVLIGFFLLLSYFTVLSSSEPQWYILLFPYAIWPLGNIAITASVMMVIAVSYERFLAICSPLQYKPSPGFYVAVVVCLSVSVNFGRFFEYELTSSPVPGADGDNDSSSSSYMHDYAQSRLMMSEDYVVFSRYWNEIFITGVLPIVALSFFNLSIWRKIRSSHKFRKLHEKSSAARFAANSNNSKANNNASSTATATATANAVSRSNSMRLINNGFDHHHNHNRLNSAPHPAHQCRSLSVVPNPSPCDSPVSSYPASHTTHLAVSAASPFRSVLRLGPPPTRAPSDVSLNQIGQANNHGNHTSGGGGGGGGGSSGERSSTPLLMGIVVVFCLCHFFRLFLQLDSIFNPSIMGGRHYEYCRQRGLFASPFSVWILTSCNQLSLVVNSSINFVVYCFVGRSFRKTLFGLFARGGGGGGGGGVGGAATGIRSANWDCTLRGGGGGGGNSRGAATIANPTLEGSPPGNIVPFLGAAKANNVSMSTPCEARRHRVLAVTSSMDDRQSRSSLILRRESEEELDGDGTWRVSAGNGVSRCGSSVSSHRKPLYSLSSSSPSNPKRPQQQKGRQMFEQVRGERQSEMGGQRKDSDGADQSRDLSAGKGGRGGGSGRRFRPPREGGEAAAAAEAAPLATTVKVTTSNSHISAF